MKPYIVTWTREVYVAQAHSADHAIEQALNGPLAAYGYDKDAFIEAFPEQEPPGEVEAEGERELPEGVEPDFCRYCGAIVGYGVPLFHLGICDDTRCLVRRDQDLRGE